MEISLRQGGEVKERTLQRVLDHCRALEKKYPKISNIQGASDVEHRKKIVMTAHCVSRGKVKQYVEKDYTNQIN